MQIQKVGVVGGGTAGRGIARTLAHAGVEVRLCEIGPEPLQRSLTAMREALNRDISRWSITEAERDAVLARVQGCMRLEELAEMPVVIEAIWEDFKEKAALFDRLDRLCREQTVLLTNTSTIPVTDLAEQLPPRRRSRFAGLHFIHPVSRVPMVELVRGRDTGPAALEMARRIAQILDKEVIEVAEYPGYVTSRLTLVIINEAVHTLMEGVATRDAIDRATRLRFGWGTGPLALADEMGLDSVFRALESLWGELALPQFRPAPLLRLMVMRGWHGEKSGQGFYRYDETGKRIEEGAPDLSRPELEELMDPGRRDL